MRTDRIIGLLGTVLFVSLAVNIFMAGAVVGNSVNTAHKAASDAVAQDKHLRDSLPEADKLALKQAMDAKREKITQLHDEIEGMKNDIRAITKKDAIDEKALNVVLESKKKKELELLELVHETRLKARDKMSPEGRAILSKTSRLGFDLNAVQCR